MGTIGRDAPQLGEAMKSNEYGRYLLRLLEEDVSRPDNSKA